MSTWMTPSAPVVGGVVRVASDAGPGESAEGALAGTTGAVVADLEVEVDSEASEGDSEVEAQADELTTA